MNTLLFVQTTQGVEIANQAATQTVEKLNIIDLIFDPASVWIMVPLMILLAISIYIFIERWLTLNRASKADLHFMNNIRDFIHDGKIESAIALCKGNPTSLSRMIEKGLSRIGKPLNDISAAVENTGKLEVQRLEKRVSLLATISGVSPMLGFLGTVTGMVLAFHTMSANPNNLNISSLSTGIYSAMITTVGGLIVGIIAYVLYNLLVSKISQVVYMLEANTTEFMDLLHEPV
ncbi:MAG: MotA/TolQ/ExbB proton channel family protein [Bacteroidales bacterium]|jgi:biopolymer transport protein ExbB|nr:MotA/TolQ/ExbB proton channel family protein [Bacteroidales bacterium]